MNNLKEKYHGKKIDHMNILNIEDAKKWLSGRECIVVTGVTGQDGSHMVDFLLENTDYIVFGCVRRLSVYNHTNIFHINSDRFRLINFDLTDANLISRTVESLKPKYFINLAAQSFVGSSWDFALQTWETNSTSVLNILEAIRIHYPSCRFYQAGSSEEFGDVLHSPQSEHHPLRPRSPYGASKAAARQLIKVWRDSYDLYAIQGWLFNHEGTRRGEEFVTRKITKNVARIQKEYASGDFKPLELGNIDALRDWSDAEDFVEGIWLMLNQEKPKEYVLSSNETHTIREFVEEAFNFAGFGSEKCRWDGHGVNEKYYHEDKILVQINTDFYRPAEVELLLGDSDLARKELGWKPKTDFLGLVRKMVAHDIDLC
jgi:GDPmannose 4,6-dehydratase